MVGLLLVDRPGLDRLREELVHSVGGLQVRALLSLSAKFESLSDLHLREQE